MSGIVGYAEHKVPDVAEIVGRMAGVMRHLPHQQIETASPGPGIAAGRLHIGIFNQHPQPVIGAEGQVWLWMCGELYHQQARRQALTTAGQLAADADDTVLALATYLQGGAPALADLEGAFVIAVWDARTGELVVVNDRYGLYPHYYAHTGGTFAFAPEIKGVLAAPRVSRRLDDVAIAQYVRFQQLLGDRTWFDDVKVLPAATILRYDPATDVVTRTRYWDWDQIGMRSNVGLREASEETIRLFQRAIDAMTAGSHRIGIYLSGGLDGRVILGFVRQEIPVQTITFGQAPCRDVVYARELARRARRPNHWFELADGRWVQEYAGLHLALTEGQHSWIHAHGISTFSRARELIDVNLSGWDGGTVFGGFLDAYERDHLYRHAPDEAQLMQRFYDAFTRKFTWPGLTDDEASRLWDRDGMRDLAYESLRAELAQTKHYAPDRRADYFFIQQVDRRQFQYQIVTPRAHIEVRCPFFDYAFIEHIYSLPEHIRATPHHRYEVITRRMPHLALVPHDENNRLPHSNRLIRGAHALTHKVKRRIHRHIAPIFPDRPRLYADYEHYLRTDLRAWAEAILFDPRTLARGLFRPATVRALWERHLAGTELWTIGKIAPLISLELVLRALHDETPVAAPLEREYIMGQ